MAELCVVGSQPGIEVPGILVEEERAGAVPLGGLPMFRGPDIV